MQKYKPVHSFNEVRTTAKLRDMVSAPLPSKQAIEDHYKLRVRARHLAEDLKFEREMHSFI